MSGRGPQGAMVAMVAMVAMLTLMSAGCDREQPAWIEHYAPPDAPQAEPSPRAESSDPLMTGVLVPEFEVVLVASGFARVERLDAEVGDHVDAGQLIAKMDVRGDQSELASATSAWRAGQAELDRLTLELEQTQAQRTDSETLEGIVSRVELRDQRYAEKLAAARRRSAGASLRQQRSRMDEASIRIAEAELRAPFAGSVARRHVDPGATLGQGDPVVQLISDAHLVRFAVPEHHGAALRLGVPVVVHFEREGLERSGEVVAVAPEIEAGTRLIFAEARLRPAPGDPSPLRIGAVGQVRFAVEPRPGDRHG